ncbi:MAG: DUF624 domain-containing protein [Clostridia bacterium]|nr:DUF624 domain-containing protein [Clostridia bacterium]MBR6009186.1 DUF624 domain-containing protein [Clostridia bacterium]
MGLFDRYFYGKAGQGDYTVEQMPTNRKQLFFTTLKVRLSSMIGVNLLHFLWMIPLFIWLYVAINSAILYITPEDVVKLPNAPQGMVEAYDSYNKAYNEYDAIINAQTYLNQNNAKLSDIRHNIETILAGGEVTRQVTVIEGGEATAEQVTLEQLRQEESEMLALISENELNLAKAGDEDLINGLKAQYNDNVKVFNLYARQLLNGNILTSLLIMIPLIALCAVGRPGMMYVLRNWARDEHSFVWQDYKQAIKENWKQALGIGILNGLSFLLVFVAYVTYGQMAENSWFFNIPQALMVVLLILWWMANELMFPMLITYEMKFKDILKNSIIIALARLPWAFLILLGSVAIPLAILWFIPLPFSLLVFLLLYALFGLAFKGFIEASFANSCFDRYLNPRIEGAEVGKGLYKPEEDTQTEDETATEEKPERFWEHNTK